MSVLSVKMKKLKTKPHT